MKVGQAEYGEYNFLGEDLPLFIYEELADLANYVGMLYVRLRLIEEAARESGIDLSSGIAGEVRSEDTLPSDAPAFVKRSEVLGILRRDEAEG